MEEKGVGGENHSFPRVEDERVFRHQTPLGLCGLDCLLALPPPLCHLFLFLFFKRERKGEKKNIATVATG